MEKINVLIENWKRESRLLLMTSKEDPSDYADGYATAMGNCAIRLGDLILDVEVTYGTEQMEQKSENL